jgi:hypothetical protein
VDGRRNASGLDLRLIVTQLNSPNFRSSNGFSPRDIQGKESSKDGKNDPGKDASVKGEEAEHKIDELPDHAFLDRTSYAWSRVAGIAGSGSGLGSGLPRPQLLLDAWTWGRLSRGQDGLDRPRCLVVVSMMNMNCGKPIGQFIVVLWEMQWLCLGLGSNQRRGRRRGEQTVAGGVRDPIVFGMEGEADVSVGFDEIVNG